MKKITILLVIMILAVSQLMAQAPQKFTYQAVVRNAGNQLVPNTLVGVQVAILQDGAGEQGTPVYAERHIQSTNANGLVTLKIGEGNVLFGNFNTINWKSGVFFIDVGIDPTGGSDYSIWSTQQMLSVPYALYANEAGNSFSGDYNDLTNLPQIPQIPTNVSYFNNDAGYITMDSIPEIPAVPTNVSAFQNDAGYITMDSVPEIPVVPTDVSAFTNDAGYLQSFTETQTLADVTMQGNSAGNRQLKDVADPTESYDAVNLRSLTLVMDSAQAIIQQMQQQLSQSQQEWQETQEQWQIQQQQMQQQWQETQQQWQIQQMQLQQQIDSLTLILNAMAADTAFTQWNTSVVNETACNAYEWHGETYTQSGVYLYGFTNTDGSNNVEALNLTIVTSDTTHLQEEACESYILNNTTYTESGDYYLFLTNQFGCDSVVFLHLTVHQCTHNVVTDTACETYTWHNVTYDESGVYTYAYTNEYGCASADTLHLTVYHGTHHVVTDTVCESYIWHDSTYTESGVYTYDYTDENGCASVDTLILTIFQGCTMDEKSCPGTPLLTDVDGNTYGTVQIGEQCWMRSNLRTLHYADGTAVPAGDTAHSETDPFYYDYESCFTLPERGYYYNWPAVMHSQPASCTNPSDVQGICPDGWHVPSDREWTQMIDYLADKSEYYCDRFSYFSSASLASDTGWTYNNSFQCAPGDHISHNATGFTAIPAGFYQLASRLDTWYISYGLGGGDCTQGAYFWCSTENSADKAYYRAILNSFHNVSTSNVSKDVGFSVRCIMNTETETDTIDEKSCPGIPSVTDIDGNTYPTVQIGDQCWMRSNLRTTRYADGTAVPAGNMNFSKTEPYYYNFSSQGGDGTSQFFPLSKRGYLYNWAAAMHGAASSNTNPSQVQGVCPNGWHVPSNEEWTQLENFVRSQSQYVCGGSLGNTSGIAKALTSTTGWKSYHGNICNPCYNPSSNNATGFNAMPVGSYDYNGGLGGTELTWFISSTENDSTSIHYCMLWYNGYYLGRFTEPKDKGFSVRCLRNENGSVPPPPSDCSSYHISISGGTVLCSGESTTLTASEASNYSWSNGSNTVSITVSPTATTTYSVTGTNSEGCVDSASITVTVNPATNSSIVETACGSFTWHDSTYTQSGTYTYAYLNEQGCASVDTLHLTVSNTDYTDFTDEACDSYVWNGETYTASGDYTQTFTAANGCDSVVTLHLTIHQGTHNVEVVESSEPYTWHGQTYTTSGTYTYVYTNENDCPSVDTLRLTVSSLPPTPPIPPIPPIDTLADGYPCPNAHTVIDHEGNVYNTVLIGNQCWTKENMRCITSPNTGSSLLTEFSSSASKAASWHSGNASHDPAYGLLYNWCAALDTFKTTGGVPEVAVANSSTTLYCSISGHRRGICPQGWHVPNDTEWAQLTSYVYNNGYRCSDCSYMSLSAYYASCIAKALSDTIGWSTDDEECAVGNDLFANNATGFSALPAGCYSSNSYRYYGQKAYFWSADVSYGYADNISMSYNSDEVSRADERMSCKFSVRCLKDIFDCGTHNVETAMDCESYTWHGQPYTATGTYTYEYTNERGCASVDTLKLVIQEHVYSETSATACDEYTSHGHTFTASGTYTYDYTNENDCPSTETLHLTILQPVTLTISATACDSYDWNGQILTQSGDYTQTFTAANGCDSVVTLHLVIHEPTISTSSASSCDSYNWHGQSYNASGTYTYDYTNEFDCASTETLNLTIYSGTHNVESAMDCESYTWHGQPYSATGTYTYEYTNAHGCPSVDTLHLTIQEHVNLTSAAASCESYIWHGQIYTASGSYTADYINDHGCSCTETLNLTIYNGTHNNYTEQACSSYNWYGTDYNLSGEYTYAYADEHGCPSVDTLRLTIGNTCPGTPTVTDHEGNVYNTIQIGNQCWTKENMRCTTSPSTGTNLLNGDNLSYSGKMAYYVNHDPTTVATLGLLYNWNAAVDVWNHDYSEVPVNEYTNLPLDTTFNGYCRGICPQGWHVPSDAEWAEMINYVKSQSEYWCGDSSAHIAKALAIDTGWVEGAFNTEQNPFLQYLMDYYESLGYFTQGGCAVNDNPSTNNATCFSAPPAGFYFGLDNIWDIDGFEPSSSANFFSSTQMSQDDPNYDSSFPDANTYNAYGYGIFYFSSTVARAATTKRYGNSVRCVKD